MTKTAKPALSGALSIHNPQQGAFSNDELTLLEAIGACGSITAAAKAVGISYKTAWDRVDAINNLAREPLVERSTGGRGGGGTRLTELGHRVVTGFRSLQSEHAAYLERLGDRIQGLEDVADFVGLPATSARNQYRGQTEGITRGAVNAEVVLRISASQSLVAIITNDSVDALGLHEGAPAMALIKASWVLLSKQLDIATSARNQLTGTVARVVPGAVNAEVVLDLGDGKTICAIITMGSLERLGLAEGDAACALVKASSVILARS